MNYREWLLFWAQQNAGETEDPEVLRYTAWQSYQVRRDWTRRWDAALRLGDAGRDRLSGAASP
jgi:hypothetical protein